MWMTPLWVKYIAKDSVAINDVTLELHLYRKDDGLIAAVTNNPYPTETTVKP